MGFITMKNHRLGNMFLSNNHRTNKSKVTDSDSINGTGIFTYIWLVDIYGKTYANIPYMDPMRYKRRGWCIQGF